MFVLKRGVVFLFFWLVAVSGYSQSRLEKLKDSLATVNDEGRGDLLLTIANYYYGSSNDSALLFTDKALEVYQQENNMAGVYNCYGLAGAIYGSYGMYDTAVSILYKVVDWGEKNGNKNAEISYLELGNIYDNLNKYQEAKRFYEKAINGKYIPAKRAAYANIGLIFLHEKEYDSAAFYFNGALNEYFNSDTSYPVNIYNIGTLYLNLTSADFGKKRFNKGFVKLHKALKFFSSIDEYSSIAKVYLKFGDGFQMTGQTDSALSCYMKAFSIAKKQNRPLVQEETYSSLSDFYENQSDFFNAFKYLKKYEAIHDSLLNIGYKSDIADNEVKYKVKEKINKITILEKQKKLITLSAVVLLLSILLISTIIILILNNRRLKHKNERILSEAKRHASEMKAERASRELEELKISLREKSLFIGELQKEVDKLSNQEEKVQLNEKIEFLRKTKILTDDDWGKYYKIFNELHPGFASKINNYKTLSEGDKRQLIFLKLGFNHKEIAHLMGISQEGVKRARQRLSKKIGLDNAGELNDYIVNI